MTTSSAAASKNTLAWTTIPSAILWRIGGLFAVSLALIVSGAVVVVMICLLRLIDLSDKLDGNAFGQVLLFRGGIAQTMNGKSRPDPDVNLRREWYRDTVGIKVRCPDC